MIKNNLANYSDCLQEVLDARTERRPSYSLRAFARDLGLHPSALSRILKRKQSLSLKSAIFIAENLGFTDEKVKNFLTLVIDEKIADMESLVFESLGVVL